MRRGLFTPIPWSARALNRSGQRKGRLRGEEESFTLILLHARAFHWGGKQNRRPRAPLFTPSPRSARALNRSGPSTTFTTRRGRAVYPYPFACARAFRWRGETESEAEGSVGLVDADPSQSLAIPVFITKKGGRDFVPTFGAFGFGRLACAGSRGRGSGAREEKKKQPSVRVRGDSHLPVRICVRPTFGLLRS